MNKTPIKFLSFIKYCSYSLFLLFFILSANSCKKNDQIPSYIHIDHINLTSTYEIDGTNSHKITDAWVYVDDDLIGIFELPATFPVLASGSHKISVRAGIKIDGIAKSRGYYPFYQTYNTTLDLQAERVDTISPTVSYYPDVIRWKEDFEEGGITIAKYSNSDTNFIKTTNPADAFEGGFSAVATIDADHKQVLCVSNETFAIPQNLSPVFLELNYKTDAPMDIGLLTITSIGSTDRIETIFLNPSPVWNKIYINLTPTVNTSANIAGFRVFFNSYLPDNLSTASLYLDNIKLLYNN